MNLIRNKKLKKIILIILIIYIYFPLLNAQIDSTGLIEQDLLDYKSLTRPDKKTDEQTIISASRTAKSISDLPVTIYVVTREEIISNGYVTLVDVLKSVPGMKTSQPGSGELGEIFQMRGMVGNSYTKILINNIPVKSSVVTGLSIGAQLPIRQAERIEIIYGPASALYGADATVGVINIITKKSKTGIFAQADINLLGNRYTNFNVGGKAGKNDKILSYSFYGVMSSENIYINNNNNVYRPLSYLDQTVPQIEIEGQSYLPSELSQEMIEKYNLTSFTPYNNYEGTADSLAVKEFISESYLTGFNLKYKNFTLSTQNMYRKSHSSIGRSPYLYKYNNPQNFLGKYTNKGTFSYNKKIKNVFNTTNLSFSRSYLDRNSNLGVTFIPNGNKMYQYYESNDVFFEELITYKYKFFEIIGGVTAQFSACIPNTNYLTEPYENTILDEIPNLKVGIDKNIENFGNNSHAFNTLSEFVQTYFNFDKIKIMAGIRNDYNSLSDTSSISPRLAILYKANKNTSFRISYGKAFKPPAGNQIFSSIAFPNIINSDTGYYYAFVPNINLKPEYFGSVEIGVRQNFFNEKIQIDLSVYHNRTKNLITVSQIDPRILGYEKVINPMNEPALIYVNSSQAEAILNEGSVNLRFNNVIKRYKLNFEISSTFILKGKEILPNGDEINFYRGVPNYMGKTKISFYITKKIYFKIYNYWSSKWHRQFLPSANYYVNDYYPIIDGYFVTDIVAGFRFHKNLNIFLKINNLTDKDYSGIDATGTDVDLRYNPQRGRTVNFGMTFLLN